MLWLILTGIPCGVHASTEINKSWSQLLFFIFLPTHTLWTFYKWNKTKSLQKKLCIQKPLEIFFVSWCWLFSISIQSNIFTTLSFVQQVKVANDILPGTFLISGTLRDRRRLCDISRVPSRLLSRKHSTFTPRRSPFLQNKLSKN